MTLSKPITSLLLLSALALPAHGERIAYFPMDLNGISVKETVSGKSCEVNAATYPEGIKGIKGDAVRFDGYSTYVESDMALGTLGKFTFSLWCAMETWPIIEHDIQNERDMTMIAGNYDAETKTGFGFFVNRIGGYSFKFFSQGWPGEISAPGTLPLYQWCNLVAIADGAKVHLYNNGTLLGSANCRGVSGDGTLLIGKSANDRKLGPFNLYTINGIVDEVEIYDEALETSVVQSWQSDELPDLCTVGEGKYADDLYRPTFHGMPMRNWTNETHGLVYYNDQYHLFFQKNANGPYMSRLQWGHLVSDNLYDWHEMPIAIGSDKWYDLKGCWSGCIAIDDVVTDGKPNIIYTGVDYARAMIAQAVPDDNDLLNWTKYGTPIIDGKPSGLSDDFRDPFFFRDGDNAYIIVGSSKDNKGVCTLHQYDAASRRWTNDGRTFFQASNASSQGRFWEMPNLTKIGDRYLFTATPLDLNGGVRILYWTGTLNADGTFNPAGSSSTVELSGFAKEGYGMLSPSVLQNDGKTIAIGIVPDKLASDHNYDLGWAHTYSLPREWSLDANGVLIQKPFAGLVAMRDGQSNVSLEKAVSGSEMIGEMQNRQFEVIGEFTVADATFGFSFFKNGDKAARLYYDPNTSKLVLDITALDRIVNDAGVFNGVYETTLPETVAKGSVMKIQMFVDHSIVDIFVNDKWASSVRVFAKDAEAKGLEVFSDGSATPAKVSAWALTNNASAIETIWTDCNQPAEYVDVYGLNGSLVRSNIHHTQATDGLAKGIYLVGDKKVLVR